MTFAEELRSLFEKHQVMVEYDPWEGELTFYPNGQSANTTTIVAKRATGKLTPAVSCIESQATDL